MDLKIIRHRFLPLLKKANKVSQHDPKKAEKLYREYITHAPEDPQALFNLGVLVQRRATDGQGYYEAADFYHRAIASPVENAGIKANALNNIGLMMVKVNHVEKALGCFQRACLIDPGCVAALNNMGDALRFLGRIVEASEAYDAAIALNPDSAEAKMARGMIGICLGNWKQGWEDYESRFDVPTFPTKRTETKKPIWNGENLNYQTLLITQEQGFGDCFMFIRYAREIKKLYPNCFIACYLSGLMLSVIKCASGVDGVFDVLDSREFVDNSKNKHWVTFDYHIPIMSLPRIMGTTRENVPSEVPYIQPYAGILLPFIPCPPGHAEIPVKRVGIVWAGSPKHGRDSRRSIHPQLLQPLIDAHPECHFFSFQVGPKQAEVNLLNNVTDLAPQLCSTGDWMGTAQALSQLDLLISVDTACVHLACAMGVPVWMLTPYSPDFRWGLSGDKSPWYLTLTLFRQERENDWESVISKINERLSQ